MRKRLLLLLLFALFNTVPLAAQQAPDYSIRNIRKDPASSSTTEEGILFEVINIGGNSDQPAFAAITDLSSRQRIATEEVPPLIENQTVTITVQIPYELFTPGETAKLGISVSQVEENAGQTISGYYDLQVPANITLPSQLLATATESPTAATEIGTPAPVSTETPPTTTTPVIIPFTLDLTNPLHIALLIGAGGILLILIWMLTVILRLLFSHQPTFPSWQPPYAFTPLTNPNTTTGRRQLWQQHAQSDALTTPCSPGSFMARKMLIGMNGTKLGGWRVTAMRMNQYDMYGRVARSQTIAPKSVIRRMDWAVRKSARLSPKRAAGVVKPAARRLLKDFRKGAKRTPSLPIAIDIRLKGTHGEVRIIFELNQCIDSRWQVVDKWEPEMTVVSGNLFENFTYSLHGQRPGEKKRQFYKRLQNELTQVLAIMVQQAPPPPPPPPPALPPPSEGDTAQMKAVSGDTVPNP